MSDERGPPSEFGVNPAALFPGARPIASSAPSIQPDDDLDQNIAMPRRRSLFRRLIGWFFKAIGAFIVLSVFMVVLYRFVPPPVTLTMLGDAVSGHGITKSWMPLSRIDPDMARAAIAGEDGNFCTHHGFDFAALAKAYARNARGGRIRGGSTISQQTAKNVFLIQGGGYARKAVEAYFTVLIETIWGKRRIMEVYLNSIEWGPGVYGAEAAARKNFGRSAESLSPAQAARLAAILPSPLKWRAAKPGPYVKRRSGRIKAAAGAVRRTGMAGCVLS
jgi:monofunctional biosynthetic peptidoglycan transglycosylase